MKKYYLFTISIIFSACTLSNQQKAEKLVQKHLDSVLNDPSSYQSVSFTKLDTAMSRLIDDTTYMRLIREFNANHDKWEKWKLENPKFSDNSELSEADVKYFTKMNDLNSSYEKYLITSIDAEKTKFKPTAIGFKISHTYRAKNSMGALILNNEEFRVDSNFNKIFSVKNIDQ